MHPTSASSMLHVAGGRGRRENSGSSCSEEQILNTALASFLAKDTMAWGLLQLHICHSKETKSCFLITKRHQSSLETSQKPGMLLILRGEMAILFGTLPISQAIIVFVRLLSYQLSLFTLNTSASWKSQQIVL